MQKGQIIANVIMFIPVGVLSGWMWNWKGMWFGVGLSFGVELLQLVTSKGLCEFDDVMHNAAGIVIGVGIVVAGIARRIRQMTFEELLDKVWGTSSLPTIDHEQLPRSLSYTTKKKLMKKTPKEIAQIFVKVIAEIDRGSTVLIDTLVQEKLQKKESL